MQQYRVQFTIPVSEELVHYRGNFRSLVESEADARLLELVIQKFGCRYFVAFLYEEKTNKDIHRGLVLFQQTWMLTLH